jgi:hypothetical protein
MSSRFAAGNKAFGFCDVCSFRYDLSELRDLIVKGANTNIRACRECWDPDHPQLKLGEFPVDDPQALRNPRPDLSLGTSGPASARNIYWGWAPVGGGETLVAKAKLGTVTVST